MTTIIPEYEEAKQALKAQIDAGDLSESELRAEFQKYLDYGVSAKDAARTIIRHHSTLPATTAPRMQVNPDPVPVASLKDGDGNVSLKARLYSMDSRTVNARGEEKTLLTGLLLDESGVVAYSSWRPLEGLERGDVVSVTGAYVKEFRGEVQVSFGDRTVLERVPAEEATGIPSELPKGEALRVCDAVGASRKNVTLEVSLVSVKQGSGLVFRDPLSNRAIPPGKKRPEDAKPDLRLMGVLDDGSGSLDFYAGRELTEALLGKSLEECQEWAREAFRVEVVREALEEKLLGRVLLVVGEVVVGDGAILWARSVEVWSGDLEAPARELLEQLGGEAS